MRDARARLTEGPHVGVREVDAVCAPDVLGEPPDLLEVLDRAAAEELLAVLLLFDRLGEVRVELQPEPARELRRLLHQPLRHGERRAGRRDDPHEAGLVLEPGEPLGVGEDRVEVLDEGVGREAAVALAEVHRAARGVDPNAELARGRDLGLHETGDAAREDVVVVEDGRAAGERELGDARPRRRAHHLLVDPRPHRVERLQPREQVGLLRPRAVSVW